MQKQVYEFVSKQNNDPIIERRTCRWTGGEFAIFQSDIEMLGKLSPVIGGVKYNLPLPTLCPEERRRKRIMFRNEKKLYKRVCDLTQESFVSIYSSDKLCTVYSPSVWHSDTWEAQDYAQEIDFNLPFHRTYQSLLNRIPFLGTNIQFNENSDYTNHTWNMKDCYLLYNGGFVEKGLYGSSVFYSKNIVDCLGVYKSDHSYQLVESDGCPSSTFLYACRSCDHCHDCNFCEQCSFCYGCNNLINASYCVHNKQLSKEEYITYMKENSRGDKLNKQKSCIRPNLVMVGCEDCIGYSLYNCKNVVFSYDAKGCQSCRYVYGHDDDGTDCMDIGSCAGAKRVYNSLSIAGEQIICGYLNIHSSYCYYCQYIRDCHHCFGCFGLHNKSYCFLNKQYSKEEYERLVVKIITHMQETGEWGEFFHPSLSPFGYNETVAQEYFSLTKEDALAKGYKRKDNNYDPVIPAGVETISGDEIPSDITQVEDTILKKILICEASGRPYRIIKQELDFYRKHTLSLPRKHPDIRHQERLAKRPERNLYVRTCDKTGEEMLSVYPQDTPFKVYSEEAYQKEIYA